MPSSLNPQIESPLYLQIFVSLISINPIGPRRFFDAYVPGGGMFFHPPLKNDFLPQESIIFHPEIKFGIILEVF